MTDIEQYSEKIFEDIKHYTEDGFQVLPKKQRTILYNIIQKGVQHLL